jgi:AMMECR1 domain-containing protein
LKKIRDFQNEKFPLFVTWYKKSKINNYSLRGCIGTFREISLDKGLYDFSINRYFGF